MKKRFLALAFLSLLILSLAPQALAYSYGDDLPLYVVESLEPRGYCYLYDRPSDVYGKNLGRHENGEVVKVVGYDHSGYYFVLCSNGKEGYIHDYALKPYEDTQNRDRYRVYSVEPAGYCYLYDRPSDINGRNLGPYNNGEYILIVDWNADPVFAQVQCERTEEYGYIRKTCLVPFDQYKPLDFYALVDSTEPRGYCYLYDRASDINGRNLGRHNNGEWVRVIDWDASKTYALVECPKDQKIGYIRKTCLTPIQ